MLQTDARPAAVVQRHDSRDRGSGFRQGESSRLGGLCIICIFIAVAAAAITDALVVGACSRGCDYGGWRRVGCCRPKLP